MIQKFISIAGFVIEIRSAFNNELRLDAGTIPFLVRGGDKQPDLFMHCIPGIPEDLLAETNLLFEARTPRMRYFSICRHGSALKFLLFCQDVSNRLQQVALLSPGLDEWTVYSASTLENEGLNPFLYPLGPLVCYYLTVKYNAIMIHASGVFDGNRGRIFAGVSGAGKSTMAGLWQQVGGSVINDDRLIIREEAGEYVMYNTPMFYPAAPSRSALHAIHLVSHSRVNRLSRMKGAAAISGVMANCILHGYDRSHIEHHLGFLAGLCIKIPVYDTGFKPDLAITGFIKANEQGQN